MVEGAAAPPIVVVREYDSARDRRGVEAVERACEVGSSGGGKMCLFTDLLGDPLCRIRHSPAFLMLVRTCSCSLALLLLRGGLATCGQAASRPSQKQADSLGLAKRAYHLSSAPSPPSAPCLPPLSSPFASSRFVSFRFLSGACGSRMEKLN
jgi:hypothetical protein